VVANSMVRGLKGMMGNTEIVLRTVTFDARQWHGSQS
jgi:hypothetical protein